MGQRFHLKTASGYGLGDVVSALQKELRRGHEEQAMYWALEIYLDYGTALWQRLRVICNEDIGIGNPQAILLTECWYIQFMDFQKAKKEGSMRLVLANAILFLCRSPKSRESDHFQAVCHQRRLQKGWRLELPDYCLDKHTLRGKQMGRSWDHWFTEGCRLVPEPPPSPYQREAEELWRTSKKTKAKQRAEDDDTGDLFSE